MSCFALLQFLSLFFLKQGVAVVIKLFLVLVLSLAGQTANINPSPETSRPRQLILINLASRILEFYDQDKLVFQCRVRIGKKKTPTPTGIGFVYEKRERPVFRYVDPGPQQGEIINYAECANGLKKINHSKMRALGINIQGKTKYSLHSTTCGETIGQAISNGCIGLTVKDMLRLYPLVERGAEVKIIK